MTYKNELQTTNCPLCGRHMTLINDLKDFSIQHCNAHGVFAVDDSTNDTWAIEGFDDEMMPIKRRWYTIDNYKPLTLEQYRDMVKRANFRRLEGK
ncbi:MAG: hypothetical protein NTV61_03170 [Candidatus Bathyarchaeota archaeon]|nr:hypothetical protein [Candidatus Bathyarchaeota archaeon]